MSSSMGDLVAHIGLDASGFKRGANEAHGSLSSLVGGLGSLMGPLAGIGGAIGAAFGAKHSLEAYGEHQRAIKKLNSVLASTGGAAGLTSDEIQGYSRSLEDATGISEKLTINGAAVLATFTQIKDQATFKTALASAQDLSAVMGQDLQSSIVQIGKALNDPIKGITALRRVGVSFTQDQIAGIKAMVAAGDIKGAQGKILGELKTEFGGAAEAMAGPFGKFSALLEHISEDVGAVLAPSLKVVANAAMDILGPVANDEDAFKAMGEKLAEITSEVIPSLVEGAKEIGAMFNEGKAIAMDLADTISFGIRHAADIFQVAGIDMALSLFELVPGSEKVFQAIASFASGYIAGIGAYFDSLVTNVVSGLSEIKNFSTAVWSGISAAMQAAFSGENPLEAFTKSFTAELANQKDAISKENPASAFVNAFSKGYQDAQQGFADSGGIGADLRKQREQLTDNISKTEMDYQNAQAKKQKQDAKGPHAPGVSPSPLVGGPKGDLKLAAISLGSRDFQQELAQAMRGGSKDDVAKQQLAALQTIASNTDPDTEDDEEVVNVSGLATEAAY
jgi:hypothetical protein